MVLYNGKPILEGIDKITVRIMDGELAKFLLSCPNVNGGTKK
ncbi:hypothetical protein AGMMS50268_29960 [Spirochaetia bacterium]|nr:hypothetical protein AGMMS50268_29960 [Spirochaetia bacterium]